MKKGTARIGLGCTLIVLQILSIMGNIKTGVSFSFSFASIPSFLYSLMFALGYYFVGLLGAIMLLSGLSVKRKSFKESEQPSPQTSSGECEHISSADKYTESNHAHLVKVYTKETHHVSNQSPNTACPSSSNPAPIRKPRHKVWFIVFLVLFVVSLVGNVFLCISNTTLSKEISSQQTNISELSKEKAHYLYLWEICQDKVDFYEARIVICESTQKLYHSIDCSTALSILAKYGIDYFYLDIEVAEQYGYSPCDSCKPEQHIE